MVIREAPVSDMGVFHMFVFRHIRTADPQSVPSEHIRRFLLRLPAVFIRSAFSVGLVLLCLSAGGCSDKKDALFISGSEAEEAHSSEDGILTEISMEESTEETSSDGVSADETEDSAPDDSSVSSLQIFVDVAGAVRYPGVYVLCEGSRVFQAIDAAGGFVADASPSVLNQALPLYDGEQIYVPTLEEVAAKGDCFLENDADSEFVSGRTDISPSEADTLPSVSSPDHKAAVSVNAGQGITPDGYVNINFANENELSTLYGIGETRARAIIEYRTANGPFSSIEDIMKISGIKQGIFSKIKDQIII